MAAFPQFYAAFAGVGAGVCTPPCTPPTMYTPRYTAHHGTTVTTRRLHAVYGVRETVAGAMRVSKGSVHMPSSVLMTA